MGYNSENFIKVSEIFKDKPNKARLDAARRREEIHNLFPEIIAIDDELSNIGLKVFHEAMIGGSDLKKRLKKLEETNLALQVRKGDILEAHGYPRDYTAIKYSCSKCGDTGYVGIEMCDCMKAALNREGYTSSGLGALLTKQTFDSFKLDLYAKKTLDGKDYSAYDVMKTISEKCKRYAESFSAQMQSLLFIGGTGLGKTHLSSSIAKCIIDRGFDVVYDSAPNIITALEKERFSFDSNDECKKYFNCDLLIIDDLGTEYANRASQSVVYNLINSRLVASKAMIISTNLGPKLLEKQYESRIISRLLGEFTVLLFEGRDIRMTKI